jgi:anti-anti-sigma factor
LTALLSRDGTNFAVACDRCGHLIANLADTLHRWDPAWSQLRRLGWTGAVLATGPHTCPGCTQTPEPAHVSEQVLDEQRPAPIRRSNRITVTELALAMVVTVRGRLSVAVNAALYELLLSDRAPRRHVIVDLSRASMLDSGALDVLVRAHAHAARYGFQLCLVGLSEPMNAALRLLCLTHRLPCFADRAEALTRLRRPAPDRPALPGQVTVDDRTLEPA